jgi:pimeloyl-ACP methyl ester carboxylesterase
MFWKEPYLPDPSAGVPAVPPRPPAGEERRADFLFRVLSPRLKKVEPSDPPPELAPFVRFEIGRSRAPGRLAATWYPAPGEARGAALLVHPWVPWGQDYFHRRGRLPALRAAGYHALTFDLGGVGRSGPPAGDFYASDLEDALRALRDRSGGLPLHLWGVSAGGYWAHLVLSRASVVRGAFFEDVSAHLIRWSWRKAPWGLPGYLFFQYRWPTVYRFLDIARHAPGLRVRAAAYAGGGRDWGVLADETRDLARLAGAECLIVPGADHLEAIKIAEEDVIALALRTFACATAPSLSPPPP